MRPHTAASILLCICTFLFVLTPAANAQSGALPGDANGDGVITAADVLHLVNSLFAAGGRPTGNGDANGDVLVTVADIFYLINHLFASGPAPIAPQPLGPTSFNLIDQALASGSISAELALIYKVYSSFDDPRLPAEYRGDDRFVRDTPLMTEVALRYSTLSVEAQATLRPFLIPPFHRGSWWQLRYAPAAKIELNVIPCPDCPMSEHWFDQPTANGKVRVWYQLRYPSDAFLARDLANAIDQEIWPKLSSELSPHEPLPDAGDTLLNGWLYGGDTRLDVALVDISRSQTQARYPLIGACTSGAWTFIQFNRRKDKYELAHELMHAFQFSYKMKVRTGGCDPVPEYWWLMDATADWARDLIDSTANTEHPSAKFYLEKPHQSLNVNEDGFRYGAYLYPFFLTRVKGMAGVVGTIWANTESWDSLRAIQEATRSQGGFSDLWPEFTVYNWNRDPIRNYLRNYASEDGLSIGASPHSDPAQELLLSTATPDKGIELSGSIDHLAAHYFWFKFSDLSARSVLLKNPWKSESGFAIRALVKVNGAWKPVQKDWTTADFIYFCRDFRTERVEELVIILSNTVYADRTHKVPSGTAPPPRLFVSNIGCREWTGTVSSTVQQKWGFLPAYNLWQRTEDWTQTGTIELRRPTAADVISESATGHRLRFDPSSGTGSWQVNYSEYTLCTDGEGHHGPYICTGTKSGDFVMPLSGSLFLELETREYEGSANHSAGRQSLVVNCPSVRAGCPSVTSTIPPTPLWWDTDRLKTLNRYSIGEDGTRVMGSRQVTRTNGGIEQLTANDQWELTASPPEP